MNPSKYIIIGLFAILNLGLGYLFQLSRGVVCFLELFVLLTSGVTFWIIVHKPIEKITLSILSSGLRQIRIIAGIGSLGLGTILLNVVFVQLTIMVIMWYTLNITTPASNTLVASLTNNMGVNFFCFAALVGVTIYEHSAKKTMAELILPDTTSTINNKFLLLSQGNSLVKVEYNEIIYVQSNQNCITLYTKDKKFVKYQSLRSFLASCPYPYFKRIHGSNAVNTDFVSHIRTNANGDGGVYLKNGKVLRLSRTFKKGIV